MLRHRGGGLKALADMSAKNASFFWAAHLIWPEQKHINSCFLNDSLYLTKLFRLFLNSNIFSELNLSTYYLEKIWPEVDCGGCGSEPSGSRD